MTHEVLGGKNKCGAKNKILEDFLMGEPKENYEA
jgi:hypothetical protein